ESEDLAEIDRFCDAMASIRAEIDEVASGRWSAEKSPLRGAPHTAVEIADEWPHAYSREQAAYPYGPTPDKYWSPVGRIDQAHGDRNLVCSCPPIQSLAT